MVNFLLGMVTGMFLFPFGMMLSRWIEVRLAHRSLAKAVEEFNKVAMTQAEGSPSPYPTAAQVARGRYVIHDKGKLN